MQTYIELYIHTYTYVEKTTLIYIYNYNDLFGEIGQT